MSVAQTLISQPTGALRFAGPGNLLPADTAQVISFALRSNLPMNQYIQYVPVTAEAMAGGGLRYAWWRASRDDSIRIINGNTDSMLWPDGAIRSHLGDDKGRRFAMQSGMLKRYNDSTKVPHVANESWARMGLLQRELRDCVSRMLTARCQDAWQVIQNAPWSTFGNSNSANTLNGGLGNWVTASSDPNSQNFNAIEQTLLNAVDYIEQMTNGAVTESELVLVLNPKDAIKIANAPEIRHIVNVNQQATVGSQGFKPGLRKGLPLNLYGIPVVIENQMIVTDAKLAAGTEASVGVGRNYIMPSGTAYLMARPGALVGEIDSPSFSTIQIFYRDSLLEVEVFPDTENRLSRAHCSEFRDIQAPATVAGMQITGIV